MRLYLPGFVDITGPFGVAEIGRDQSHGYNGVAHVALQEVRAGIAGALRIRIAGVRSVEEKLAARKFVSHLRKLVIAILSAHAQRMFSDNPGEVVDELKHFVVDGERAAGGVAKTSQIVAQLNVGD